MTTTRGRFLVLEGADGAGTTTQARVLADAIVRHGGRAHVTQEPSGGPIGRMIREMLGGGTPSPMGWRRLALLFAADRLHHYEHEIEPHLAVGVHVISDRYVLSSLVYQSLHVPEEWVGVLNRYAPAPDGTFVLDVDPDEAWQRQQRRAGAKEIYDDPMWQRDICARYRAMSSQVGALCIDGHGAVDDVHARIWAQVGALLSLGATTVPPA